VRALSHKNNLIFEMLEYLLVLLMVLDVHFMWTRSKNLSENGIIFGSIVILVFLIIPKMRAKISRRVLARINIVMAYSLIFILLNQYKVLVFMSKYLIPLVLFALYQAIDCKDEGRFRLWHKLSTVIVIIAAISLFFYFFGTTLGIIKPSGIVTFNWGGERACYTYYDVYYEAQTIFFLGKELIRNCGIFTESPMYSFVLSTALIIELFMYNCVNRKRAMLLILAILTTFSTTGMIVIFLAILIRLFLYMSESREKRSLLLLFPKFLFFVVLFGISLYVIPYLLQVKQTEGYISYNTRYDDFIACLNTWKDNFLVGSGFGNFDIIQQNMSAFRSNNLGLSTGIGVLVAQGGLMLLMQMLIILASYFYTCLKKNNNNECAIVIIFMFLYTLTNVPYKLIIIYLMAFALNNIGSTYLNKSKAMMQNSSLGK